MSNTITGHTILTCLLGSPVSHSISPAMHNEAFRYWNLDYAYMAFDVNTDTLASTVETLKTIKARGFNLTMPNKHKMCALCDRLSPAAEISGAVNTVVNDNGILTGYTTDGIGFIEASRDAGFDIIGKKITLLGAGGASTAILVQAALDGVSEISVFSRRLGSYGRAASIIEKLKDRTNTKINLYDYDNMDRLREEIFSSYMLVNGTSVGMAPHEDACILPDASYLNKDVIVSDIIYNPRETKLLSMAKKLGAKTFNGTYLLLYQGAEAFRLWTGKPMPISLIKEKCFSFPA